MSNKIIKNRPSNNSNDIVIDDGSKVFNIKNKRGEHLGKFVFNPSDVEGVMERHKHVVEKFEELQNKLGENNDFDEKQFLKMSEEMKKEVGYLFNADVSEFFKTSGPFSPLGNGEVFVENIINAVGAAMESETGKRLNKVKSRASKYTDKWRK